MSHRHLKILSLLALAIVPGGCSPELETGYKPRALNDTSASRRAYYAAPFTPEAAPPPEEQKGGAGVHKPSAY